MLVGQIFNIQEHWPGGVLLWALCALAGWALFRDQAQQTIGMFLIPAWIICEWTARTDGYRGSEVFLARMVTVFAAVYLTCFLHCKKKLVFGLLFGARLSDRTYAMTWLYPTPTLVAHALVALVAAFLTWRGVQQRSRALINYGVVCFAIAVLWFYFSSVMGKLERSFSLMMLGNPLPSRRLGAGKNPRQTAARHRGGDMNPRTRAIALLVIQCVLVSSIAAKYLYERKTCPRGSWSPSTTPTCPCADVTCRCRRLSTLATCPTIRNRQTAFRIKTATRRSTTGTGGFGPLPGMENWRS